MTYYDLVLRIGTPASCPPWPRAYSLCRARPLWTQRCDTGTEARGTRHRIRASPSDALTCTTCCGTRRTCWRIQSPLISGPSTSLLGLLAATVFLFLGRRLLVDRHGHAFTLVLGVRGVGRLRLPVACGADVLLAAQVRLGEAVRLARVAADALAPLLGPIVLPRLLAVRTILRPRWKRVRCVWEGVCGVRLRCVCAAGTSVWCSWAV